MLGAITGSIAEAYYGMPKAIEEKTLTYLDTNQKKIINAFKRYKKLSKHGAKDEN